jgi:predicted nucleic acid-binding protein
MEKCCILRCIWHRHEHKSISRRSSAAAWMSAAGVKGARWRHWCVRPSTAIWQRWTSQSQRSAPRSGRCLTSRRPTGVSGIVADVLVDTDVFIDHLRGARRITASNDVVHYSVVTRAELFAGRGSEEELVRLLLAPFREIPVDGPVAESGGRLRRTHGIGIADALIAATALQSGCALVTRNVRHFNDVPGLRLRRTVR